MWINRSSKLKKTFIQFFGFFDPTHFNTLCIRLWHSAPLKFYVAYSRSGLHTWKPELSSTLAPTAPRVHACWSELIRSPTAFASSKPKGALLDSSLVIVLASQVPQSRGQRAIFELIWRYVSDRCLVERQSPSACPRKIRRCGLDLH